jgi:hypothetical protein
VKLTITRRGTSPTARTPDLPGWLQWAYGESAGVGQLEGPVVVKVSLGCQDRRGMAPATSAWPVVDAVLSGLVAASVLRIEDVIEVTICRPQVTGESELTLSLSDANEPF